jgi:hypothetical protein
MKDLKIGELGKRILGGGCGCDCNSSVSTAGCGPSAEGSQDAREELKVLNVDLVVIDLSSCKRCVPTGDQLREAVKLLAPAAEALGIELRHRETVVQTPEEARKFGLLTSPTIRLNGRDIAQDIRESRCESCGDLTENNTDVDCREWHYGGKVYSAAPIAMLVESIMQAMLKIDEMPPLATTPIRDLPDNLKSYFSNKKGGNIKGCCS